MGSTHHPIFHLGNDLGMVGGAHPTATDSSFHHLPDMSRIFRIVSTFIADRDPHEYGFTYFEMFFRCDEPPQVPCWPFKFTVGFS
jgi:hypothetical protein